MHLTASSHAEIDQLLIRQLHHSPAGISAADLAEQLGCTAERVACHLRRLGRERNARARITADQENLWTAH